MIEEYWGMLIGVVGGLLLGMFIGTEPTGLDICWGVLIIHFC